MKVVALVLPVILLSARNSVEGLGKDTKGGGDALEKAATK
jgi:predicted small secreted protein